MSRQLLNVIVLAALCWPAAWAEDDEEALRAARLERLAEFYEDNATVLGIYDRAGRLLRTVGEVRWYADAALSPDASRIAFSSRDIESETMDVWVIEVESGDLTRMTRNESWDVEWAVAPVWSADGKSLAYVAQRDGYESIYRAEVGVPDSERLIYRHPGANLWLSDWSLDGKWLSFAIPGLTGRSVHIVNAQTPGSEPIEIVGDGAWAHAGAFSPDNRYLSYYSEASGTGQIYLARIADITSARASGAKADLPPPLQISSGGARVALRSGWRSDNDEFFYVSANGAITAAAIDEDDASAATNRLFQPSQAIWLNPITVSASRNGERFLLRIPHKPELEQITIFDANGKALKRLGEPGMYRNPSFSPDGRQVTAMRVVPATGHGDIWVFDVQSGQGRALTADVYFDNFPIFSPDGERIAFESERGMYASIFVRDVQSGNERELFRYTPGAFLQLTDWSADGRWLTFQDGCWGVLHTVSAEQNPAPNPAVEWLRHEYLVAQLKISPDSKYAAFQTDELKADEFYLYVSPFDATRSIVAEDVAGVVRFDAEPVEGVLGWRADGRALFYLSKDWVLKTVELDFEGRIRFGEPRELFKLPARWPGIPKQWRNVHPDGEHFVFVATIPVNELLIPDQERAKQ